MAVSVLVVRGAIANDVEELEDMISKRELN